MDHPNLQIDIDTLRREFISINPVNSPGTTRVALLSLVPRRDFLQVHLQRMELNVRGHCEKLIPSRWIFGCLDRNICDVAGVDSGREEVQTGCQKVLEDEFNLIVLVLCPK